MRLPDDAWVRTTPETREDARKSAAWPLSVELAALCVDLLAVLASERRIKKPFEVPRPSWMKGDGDGVKRAVAVLKANAGGRVRISQGAT